MRRFLSDTVGGLPRTFWTLFTALLVNRIGAFGMLLLPTYLTTARGTTLAMAGLITGGYGAGGAIGTLTGGVLADRWGRKRTYLLGTSASAILMLALGFAGPLWLIALLAILLGLTHMLPSPAMVAAIVDVTPEADRPRAFNLQFWAFNMGSAVAAALAGIVAEFSFFALFVADASMTAITALLILFWVPETLPTRSTTGPRPGLGRVLTDRVFMAFVGLTFVLALLTAQGVSTVQLAMAADGLRPAVYGLVVSLGGAMIVLGQLFVPKLVGHRRHGRVLAFSFTLLAFGFASVAFADLAWVYLGAAVIWTLGQMFAAPANASVIAELAPWHMRARYQGVFNLVFPAAFFVAPAVGGWSLQTLGAWHWIVCGVLGLAGGWGHLAASAARESRLDRERAALSVAEPVAA
ncbi:MFS transporter [Rhizocola hellebori]|uniref:MFS transporter n=1 Tax=Rhizocola hellebori TaxID=1392758 RepID=A0A8J3VJQ5_9ACTN|nr:MFS transporter [Rhizocola hellebori]GIH08742.1 MFS transporter [Rhizocola hellebori]